MSIPKQIIFPIRYFRPFLCRDERAATRFETGLQSFLGQGIHVVPVGRARSGIYLLAKFARQGTRNRVVMLAHTIPDVVNMVRFAGCDPVFVDTLPESTNVDLQHLESLLDPSVCCVFLTHYHVNQNNLGEIHDLCRRKGILLFDDCAIAAGGEYPQGPIGTCTDASVFSLSGFKTLNYIWGGAVTTRHQEIGDALRKEVETFPRLRVTQYRRHINAVLKYDLATRRAIFSLLTFPTMQERLQKGSDTVDHLAIKRIESTYLDETILSRPSLGALHELSRKIGRVPGNVDHARRIASIYDEAFSDRMVSRETPAEVRAGSCFVNYPVVVDPDARERIYRQLMMNGFHVGLSHYPNVHGMDTFKHMAGRSDNCSALVRSMITLPTHPRVTPSYAASLAEALGRAINGRAVERPRARLAGLGKLRGAMAQRTAGAAVLLSASASDYADGQMLSVGGMLAVL